MKLINDFIVMSRFTREFVKLDGFGWGADKRSRWKTECSILAFPEETVSEYCLYCKGRAWQSLREQNCNKRGYQIAFGRASLPIRKPGSFRRRMNSNEGRRVTPEGHLVSVFSEPIRIPLNPFDEEIRSSLMTFPLSEVEWIQKCYKLHRMRSR